MEVSESKSRTSETERLAAAVERIAFLDWRLEQLEGQLVSERKTLNLARGQVAELTLQQAGWSEERRALEERLAHALQEATFLHERLVEADLTRQTMERRLDDRGDRVGDELASLSQSLLIERQRGEVKAKALENARARISELEHGQHRFYDRLVRWQDAARAGEHESIDLADLIAEMRGEILRLESRGPADSELARSAEAPSSPSVAPVSSFPEAARHLESLISPTRRIHALRLIAEIEKNEVPLALSAGKALVDLVGADAAPALLAMYTRTTDPMAKASLLELLGRSGAEGARRTLDAAAEDPDWRVRAPALEAAIRAAKVPGDAEAVLAKGLADRDPRIRRRMVLAAASERTLTAIALAGRLEIERDAATRRMIAAALRGKSDPAVLRALLFALGDVDEAVRGAAARALAPVCGAKALGLVALGEPARRIALAELRREILDSAEVVERKERHGSRHLP